MLNHIRHQPAEQRAKNSSPIRPMMAVSSKHQPARAVPGVRPSAMTIPNSRVRSSTDISCVLSTLNATRMTRITVHEKCAAQYRP